MGCACRQEDMEVKHAMLHQIDEALPTEVIVGSSTSSFLLLDMIQECSRAPERFVLSHPFNRAHSTPPPRPWSKCFPLTMRMCPPPAPHLMPLVELFGTDDGSVAKAIAFYRSVGRHPITMNKQLPGHVANRLTSAIFREAVWMLKEGIVSRHTPTPHTQHGYRPPPSATAAGRSLLCEPSQSPLFRRRLPWRTSTPR